MSTNQSIGYMNAPIPQGINLVEEINRMRKEKMQLIWPIIIRQPKIKK